MGLTKICCIKPSSINTQKQKESHDINKMPVPCPSFKPEMMFFVEVIKKVTVQYDSNKSSTNNYVKSVKPCGDKKCAPISTINNSKIKTQHNSYINSNSALYSPC